ncbi:hypothetical protein AYI69_g7286 [Smittium culicis]|uniref:Uncharacterized protein n=1 Tax=Smittium culicis TaxID=133412 RepID=A0A1R1XT73_9FUNG|nr:hypothetical protein AYI69_g7286 [Smittium culicis]
MISPPAAAQKYVVDRLRHTQVAAGAKFFEFLVDDFHVRQALGSPECAYAHFSNVLKAQLQVRIHSLKVSPVAFFPNFAVHRPPVDDRPVISPFPVNYRDYSLTIGILSAKFFYPPGTPGHPGGHPGLHRFLDEVGDPCFWFWPFVVCTLTGCAGAHEH